MIWGCLPLMLRLEFGRLAAQGFGSSQRKGGKHRQAFSDSFRAGANFFTHFKVNAAGAQAFANFDTYLAPFIAHDGLEYNQTKQALQEFIF